MSGWRRAAIAAAIGGALGAAAPAVPAAPAPEHPRCFGAASRDPRRACHNPVLRETVSPRPAAAQVTPSSPCRVLHTRRVTRAFDPCAFGVARRRSRATVALLGDSHARMWRAALEVVALERRWRGVSITRPGCPFSVQIPVSPDLGPADCVEQHGTTLAWLRAHREVRTVFVASWAQPAWGPQGGVAGYGGTGAGFAAMLDQVPPHVRRIYVLRDIPATTVRTPGCVRAALRRHRDAGRACALPRASVLTPDPLAAAAAARGPRVRVIDLTRQLCAPARCFPVVGGAYVPQDDNHMNAVFAATLAPFVARYLR
ncbi:SGNH hydrolase domain-containing protein [Capillimicrobium parvum]|uniref:SGNH domain-containing protein n=1 Tax=Capillimicrobium parvum TaxID=2884022 RepID=A0A9E6Y5I7_9ACTN|nr:SGNH hydrolase domain-containing protein [Capillimicrobium parvum]UGS39191.1 hypothetical protein DSM104329_05623 [Capillimicrobium parvum]